MNTSSSGVATLVGSSCTNYNGGQVTITVPSNGMVLVQAQMWLRLSHTTGTEDVGFFMVGNSPTDCVTDIAFRWPVDLASAEPSSFSYYGGFAQRAFPVTAGTHTFYLNGLMQSGQSAGDVFYFYSANMAAVFYPS